MKRQCSGVFWALQRSRVAFFNTLRPKMMVGEEGVGGKKTQLTSLRYESHPVVFLMDFLMDLECGRSAGSKLCRGCELGGNFGPLQQQNTVILMLPGPNLLLPDGFRMALDQAGIILLMRDLGDQNAKIAKY